MRKRNKEYRRKFVSNTYMREATNYEVVTIKEDDLFITIKKYIDIEKPISFKQLNKDIFYVDKNFYLVEFTPINENYNIRFYYNDKKEFIDYYIDITLENGVKYKMPYYIDLYLDILHDYETNKPHFVDEDELKEALDNKIISNKDYKLAYKVGNKLLKEIEDNKNKYMNIDAIKYINKYFN